MPYTHRSTAVASRENQERRGRCSSLVRRAWLVRLLRAVAAGEAAAALGPAAKVAAAMTVAAASVTVMASHGASARDWPPRPPPLPSTSSNLARTAALKSTSARRTLRGSPLPARNGSSGAGGSMRSTPHNGAYRHHMAKKQVLLPSNPPVPARNRPHVIMHMADDLGYYHVGFNAERTERPSADVASVTPHITSLARSGIVLTRHYVHWHCSPSRRAFLTGRLPIHTFEGLSGEERDDMDLRWQTVGKKLESVGYRCHWYGKGHTGFRSVNHLPVHTGFSAGHLGFLGANMFHNTAENRWMGDMPFTTSQGSRAMGRDSPGVAYTSFLKLPESMQYSTRHFGDTALKALHEHDTSEPLFMFMAWQEPHRPYDPPTSWNRRKQSCDGIAYDTRSKATRARTDACAMFGLLDIMDQYVGKFTDALRLKGMWENTLVLFVSDNGAGDAGVNYPLRGEKIWYPTLCNLAGADPRDDPPEPPNLKAKGQDNVYGNRSWPGVDGVDIWPFLMQPEGRNSTAAHAFLPVTGEVMVAGRFKLVVAQPDPDLMENKFVLSGWRNPNGSWVEARDAEWGCSAFADRRHFVPCLFDIENDDREQLNLAHEMPDLVRTLWSLLNESLSTSYSPNSPPELLGYCDEECAWEVFKTHAKGRHPVCGVPGCT